MKVRFTVKADAWDEIDLPDDLTDSGVQQELRQWVLDVANFWWEIKKPRDDIKPPPAPPPPAPPPPPKKLETLT